MEVLKPASVDLHVHTCHSDGDLTTRQVLSRAKLNGVGAIAITDHDTVDAFLEDQSDIDASPVDVIAGIEISTETPRDRHHILGLGIDPRADSISGLVYAARNARIEQAHTVVNRLKEAGWLVDDEIVFGEDRTLTKAQIAKGILHNARGNQDLIVRHTGVKNPTIGRLIEATLIPGMPFYVPKQDHLHPAAAVEAIHAAGGVAILAHPSFNILHGSDPGLLFDEAVRWGIDGIEGIYVQYDRSSGDQPHEYRDVIADYCSGHGLIMTGGSDFHTLDSMAFGASIDIGFHGHEWKVPISVLEQVIQVSERYKRTQ